AGDRGAGRAGRKRAFTTALGGIDDDASRRPRRVGQDRRITWVAPLRDGIPTPANGSSCRATVTSLRSFGRLVGPVHEVGQRIERLSVAAPLEVEVGPVGDAGLADLRDHLAALDALAGEDVGRAA